ncbi:MAG TPA: hypothetical protein VHA70_11320 [Bauldia sp.]|nr:hypothetical protein [Bauldia sp.]
MFRNPLARDVTVVLVLKTVIVIAAALFVFGPSQRPYIDAAAVDQRITSTQEISP